MIQRKRSKFIFLSVCFSVFAALNAFASTYIVNKLQAGFDFQSQIVNFLYVQNTGAAFSIMENSRVSLSFIAIIALALVLNFIIKNLSWMSATVLFWLSLLLAGISGNMVERMYLGYVRDYIEFAFFDFPVFNISDVYINISVFAIILMLLNKKYYSKL